MEKDHAKKTLEETTETQNKVTKEPPEEKGIEEESLEKELEKAKTSGKEADKDDSSNQSKREGNEKVGKESADSVTAENSMEEDAGNKKKERKPRKDKKTQQIDELKDRMMRTMAEFDNFRKRSEKEKSQMFEIGAKNVIEKMLPVLDNFERGLKSVTEEEKTNGFVQGMEKTYKQFITTLEELEVRPIEAVGKEFDPNFHNAVMHGEDEELGANMVSEELQKGYTYRDMVIRYSMVKVVN